ncbi:MAG: DEAD/DEAH box helicase [Planctomycetia bacterium]|jgi:ATP-dependent RNA helicase DeaD|nr:DEAD/DEAH box helicase [Planctomycetia bacterium]NCF99890.1 DEAD/DEAH box helicase [Planctomycetia bacterium]NCG12089.1 DEAD/DEAH box helicase [Planctomycetia bacterium]
MNNTPTNGDDFLSGLDEPDSDPPKEEEVVNEEEIIEEESKTLFTDLPLPTEIQDQLLKLGFKFPTPIQELSIPVAVKGLDLIGKAETGTGKTLAFTAPIMGKLDPERVGIQALVLCPTRELAQQVEEVASKLGEAVGIRVALVVGGIHAAQQLMQLRRGAQMVVGTPGRVLDFLKSGKIRLGWVEHVVLDEADRMLDMGFIDDVNDILQHTPPERQTCLFSATLPPKIKSLTRRFMKDPETISTISEMATVPEIDQKFIRCRDWTKKYWIHEILNQYPNETCIIFCNTRRAVIELDRDLWGRGFPAGSLHGDHDQERRFKVLEGFRDRKITTLVATDVAARGLDVEAVARVINYDVPDEVETYVHRIGRTGRAGAKGETFSLVDPADKLSWNRIVSETGFDITEEEWTPPKGIQPDPQQRRRSGPPSRGRHGGPRAGGSRGSGPRSGGSRSGGGGNRSKGGGPRKGPSGGGDSRNRRSRPDR